MSGEPMACIKGLHVHFEKDSQKGARESIAQCADCSSHKQTPKEFYRSIEGCENRRGKEEEEGRDKTYHFLVDVEGGVLLEESREGIVHIALRQRENTLHFNQLLAVGRSKTVIGQTVILGQHAIDVRRTVHATTAPREVPSEKARNLQSRAVRTSLSDRD